MKLNALETQRNVKIPQPVHLPQLITTPHANELTKHLIQYIQDKNMTYTLIIN
jgi:hypothetical protein